MHFGFYFFIALLLIGILISIVVAWSKKDDKDKTTTNKTLYTVEVSLLIVSSMVLTVLGLREFLKSASKKLAKYHERSSPIKHQTGSLPPKSRPPKSLSKFSY